MADKVPHSPGSDSFNDEEKDKASNILADMPIAEKVKLDPTLVIGDVYEDVRAIDMGEDGKERPFETSDDWALRLISLEDVPTEPPWTFRLWFIALSLSCFGAVLSQVFAFRPASIYVSQLFLQTAAYIMGRCLHYIVPGPGNPNPRLQTADTAFWRFMNPSKFNIKEHTGILIMGAAATHGALAISIFATDDLFYNYTPNPAVAIFTLLGSQLLGYGLAGMMRSFLVYPTFSVFPNLIPTVQMFDMLHRGQDNVLQKKRIKFFWTLFIGIFFWQWFPEYIAPLLTGISVFCLARRDSAWVTRLFGGAASNEGLGLFSICLDWNYVGSGGSAYGALFQPIQTQLSGYIGLTIGIFVFIGLLYREDGSRYDQTMILNDDFTLNEEKLAAYGLPWFTGIDTVGRLVGCLAFGATTVTHIILWHRNQIWDAIKCAKNGTVVDAHYEKMKVYKEVPFWWYTAMTICSVAMALATDYTGHSQLSWWAFFIAIGYAASLLPIIVTLYATIWFGLPQMRRLYADSNLSFIPDTGNIAQMLGAALSPGKPHANMYFTMYAYNSTEQGRSMARDLKMGQYTKTPPRVTFTMQSIGAVIGGIKSSLINYVIMKIIISSNREILLSVQGTNVWSGAGIQAFNSIGWALAKHLYAPSSRYAFIPFSIFIGLVIPIPFWLLHRKFPTKGFDKLITPMLVGSIGSLGGGINSSVFTVFLLCIFSQFWLRKYHPRWFRKYNFLMSAALDGGTEVMVFVFSFAVGGAGGKVIPFPNWALNPEGNPDYCKRLT
ncbi:peptide transporter mtd1 [Moniliophthora roreri]|nr:peptide transporter mtd1 [Moniliophthora roreri]